MKTSLALGGLFLASGAVALATLAGRTSEAPPAVIAEAPAAASSEQSLTLSVPGMHCEFACAPQVRDTLAVVPGVNGVETNVDDKTATVAVGEGFELETALAKLDEAGYPATAE